VQEGTPGCVLAAVCCVMLCSNSKVQVLGFFSHVLFFIYQLFLAFFFFFLGLAFALVLCMPLLLRRAKQPAATLYFCPPNPDI